MDLIPLFARVALRKDLRSQNDPPSGILVGREPKPTGCVWPYTSWMHIVLWENGVTSRHSPTSLEIVE